MLAKKPCRNSAESILFPVRLVQWLGLSLVRLNAGMVGGECFVQLYQFELEVRSVLNDNCVQQSLPRPFCSFDAMKAGDGRPTVLSIVGVDAAFDAIGGAHFVRSFACLARGGLLVGYGA